MTTTLEVSKREMTTKRSALPAGHMPAVVYGPKQEPIAISVDEQVFDKLRKSAGESTIINLVGLAEEVEVLIKHIDFNPAKLEIAHADFYAIERGKDMQVTVPIEFIGEAPVEKSNLGSVTKVIQDIEVTCRPSKMPAHITVDVSVLVEVTDKITVADLEKIEGVTYNAEVEDPVAVVSAARTEASELEDPAEVDMTAVATEEKGAGDNAADKA
jgi:large subunit ribosomal protein L25